MLRKLTYAFLILVLVLAGGFLIRLTHKPATERWDALKRRVDELKAAAQTNPSPRTVLRGEPQAGNAWEEYRLALRDTGSWDEGERGVSLYFYAGGRPGVDRSIVEPLLAKKAEALEHLRRGAQRPDNLYRHNWEQAWLRGQFDRGQSIQLAMVAAAQSRFLTETGKAQEAANVLLDTTVFARDLMTNSPLNSSLRGYEVYRVAFEGLRKVVESGKLSKSELVELGQKLEQVDKDFPTMTSVFAFENLPFGAWLTSQVTATQKLPWARQVEQYAEDTMLALDHVDWRFILASSETKLEVFELKEKLLERVAKLDGMSFKEARDEADAIRKDAESSPNRLLPSMMPNVHRILITHRKTVAPLRLIRAGVRVLAGGTMPELADPFGDNLLYSEENGKMKIWSIGRDATIQGGFANWRGESDLVLELPRQTPTGRIRP
jgi:hypothetical protein